MDSVDQEVGSYQEHLGEGVGNLEESRLEEEMVARLGESGEDRHFVEIVGKAFPGRQEEGLFLQDLVEVRLAYRREEVAFLLYD